METSRVIRYKNYLNNPDYRQLFNVFSYPEWLDVEYGSGCWDVVLIEEKDTLVASFPYQVPQGLIGKSSMPLLAQTLGPWLNPKKLAAVKNKTSYYYELLEILIKGLPKANYFLQQFSPEIGNHLPFYWAGWKQTTLYTYRVHFSGGYENFISSVSSKKVREFNRANKDLILDHNPNVDFVYDEYKNYLQSRGDSIQYSKEYFTKIVTKSIESRFGALYGAKTREGEYAAFLWIVYDHNVAYHMITPINPKFRKIKALNFLIFSAVKRLPKSVHIYDFEGSMIPNIEKSFREFGAIPTNYFRVRRVDSFLLRMVFNVLKPL